MSTDPNKTGSDLERLVLLAEASQRVYTLAALLKSVNDIPWG